MSLSELSIRRPVMAWMFMTALIVFGGISFLRMGVSQLPDVDFPTINISANLAGAAPEVMETEVVDIIENSVMTVQGIRKVTSSSKNGRASVTVEMELDRSVDSALQDIQAKVSEAQRKLPKDMDPPIITKSNPEDQPIIWVTLESETHSLKELMEYVQDHLQQQFSTTQDVGDINLGGFVDPNLRVWISEAKLKQYALSVTDIINAIQNEHSEPPAGFITDQNKEYNVRTMGQAKTLEEFGNILINTRGGQPNFSPLRLKDVARVEDGLNDIRRISRSMGKPSVGLGIRKQRGSNAVSVAHHIKAKIKNLEKTLPQGMKLGIRFDSTKFIEDSIRELNFTLLLSAILTALVCWLFLGSWSSTFNVILSIPTSIIGTFIVLYFSGFTLNTFTLLGLSLAIGIVVDDAIMVLENIIRHREMGKSKMDAALIGSSEIYFAALAATISIVAIFLPVAFMRGIIGKFFFQFGVTMTVAVLLSLIEAITLTPMRCSQFLNAGERTTRLGRWVESSIKRLTQFYAHTLEKCLNHRVNVCLLALLFFLVTCWSVRFIDKEFMPAEDQSRFLIRIQTPVGSSIDFTNSKFKEAEAFFASRKEFETYYVAVGGFGGGDVNTGVAFITLKPKGQRGRSQDFSREPSQADLMNLTRASLNKIPDVKAKVQDLSMRSFSASRGFPIEFNIQGPDWGKLGEYSQILMAKLEKSGGVTDLDSDYQVGMPEIQIIPDRLKASERGVSISTIGTTVNALIGGIVVGHFPKGGHRYDIRLKLEESETQGKDRISALSVRNNRGELIPLREVTHLEEKPSLQSVSRNNRERAISIFANVASGASQQTILDEVIRLGKETLPPGYRVALTGGSEAMKETFRELILALVLGIFVAYMVLASQFNSFRDPFAVLMALPFSLSGAFLALLIMKQSLNLYSMIGLILLMGIVKKNSILIVEFTNHVRKSESFGIRQALLKACPIRLRPILMTSLATIVGALPAALSIGPGAESRIPMACAVIGGVLVSTILTLYVVPCVYGLITQKEAQVNEI